ncbi:anion transporter, partial [Pseudomonas sp. MPR-R5A]
WISNTATAMMMMPIAIAVIAHVNESIKEDKESGSRFGKSLMLGIAYAASIGGLGTLIGTPPNMIFAGVVKEIYGVDISFATWMLFGVP